FRPQDLSKCQTAIGNFIATHCTNDAEECYKVEEIGNGAAGTLSATDSVEICQEISGVDEESVVCVTRTTHKRLAQDSSCPTPTPTQLRPRLRLVPILARVAVRVAR